MLTTDSATIRVDAVRTALAVSILLAMPALLSAQTIWTHQVTVGNGGGATALRLTSAGPWTATTTDSFLHISAGSASGSGNATVEFTVDPYSGLGTRVGTVTIAGLRVAVTQAGNNSAPASQSVTSLATVASASYLDADSAGNVYYLSGNTVRKWTATDQGNTTLVSTGLSSPAGIAVDRSGNVYIGDSANNAIKVWDAGTQVVATLISGLSNPGELAVDNAGNVYFSELGAGRIRKWEAASQTLSTIANVASSEGVAVDGAGNVYFSDPTNHVVQKWTAATQTLSTVVSSGLTSPVGVAVDGVGNLYIGDATGATLRFWNATTQRLTTLQAEAARGVALDGFGDVVYATGAAVKRVNVAFATLASTILPAVPDASTRSIHLSFLPFDASIAWTASTSDSWIHLTTTSGFGAANVPFTIDANSTASGRSGTIVFNNGLILTVTQPPTGYLSTRSSALVRTGQTYGVAVDTAGNVYAALRNTPSIIKWTAATDQVTTLISGLVYPNGVAVDGAGNVYFADFGDATVYKWTAATEQRSALMTSAGHGVAVDAYGNVYNISTTGALRKYSPSTGETTTIATGFTSPEGIAVDPDGNIYVADYNLGIYKWTASTQQVTPLITSDLAHAASVAVEPGGDLLIGDVSETSLKRWSAVTQTLTEIDPYLPGQPYGVAVDYAGNYYVGSYTSNNVLAGFRDLFFKGSGSAYLSYLGTSASYSYYPPDVNLTGSRAPYAEQSWVTMGPAANGVMNYTVAPNNSSLERHSYVWPGPYYVHQSNGTGTPTTLQKAFGDGQTAVPGTDFAHPLGVYVANESGRSSPGAPVTFTVVPGTADATFASTPPQPVLTNTSGYAYPPALTAGNTPGTFTVVAQIGALSVTFTLNVALANQTINFNAPSNHQIGTGTVFVTASATSGLTVTFASTTPAICTTSGNSVTMVAVGTCTIEAAQPGNYQYNPAPSVSRSFQVTSAPIGISTIATQATLTTLPPITVTIYDTITGLPAASENGVVTLTTGGVFTADSTTSVNAVNGIATFDDIRFANVNYGLKVTATYVPRSNTIASNQFAVIPTQLGTSQLYLGSAAGTSSVFLSIAGAWTATANDPFLHVSAGSEAGTGPATVAFTCDAFTGTGTRTGTLTVAGLTLTVTQAGTNSIAVKPVASPGLPTASYVAVDSAGDLYFTQSPGSLKKWTASTQQVTTLATGFTTVGSLKVDPAGNVYIADGTSIKQWSPATQQVTTVYSGAIQSVRALGLDVAGNVYYADLGGISRVNPVTHGAVSLTSAFVTGNLDVDAAGNVYYLEYGGSTSTLRRWNSLTRTVTALGTTSSAITSAVVALDGTGSVVYATYSSAAVSLWNAVTRQSGALASLPSGSVLSIARDGAGSIYVGTSANPIRRLSLAIQLADSVTVGGHAGSSSAAISYLPATSKAPWTATTADTWIHLTTASGEGGGAVSFTYDDNPATTSRTGTITLDSGLALTVTQTGMPAATSMVKSGGDSQSAGVGQSFVAPLQVRIIDQFGDPFPGAGVTFEVVPGGGGSSATLAATPVQPVATGADGVANSPILTANGTAGAFTATATSGELSQTFSLSISIGSQTITFGSLSNQTFGTAPFGVSATASSGLPVSFDSLTPLVCTVSGSNVTLVAAGLCTIQAIQPGDSNFAAATPVSQSFQVTVATQTITFGTLSNRAFGTAPFAVTATASSSLPVTLASTTTAVCTVAGSAVTLVAVGTCSLQATQAGNGNYAAATPVTQSFQVTQGAQTITFAALPDQELGIDPFTVTATSSSGLTVTVASQTTAVCTVSNLTVTLVAAGACTLQATQAGNTNYSAATPVTRTFQVNRTPQTITFDPLTDRVFGIAPFAVAATASSSLAVSFASQTTSVCTVAGSTVTLVATGTCTIRASQLGNSVFAAATAVDQSFGVTQGSQTITFATLPSVPFGTAPFAVSATASSALPVAFTSQTTSVCTVSGSTVTLTGAGICAIRASQAGNGNYLAAAPVDQSFEVTKGSQTITFAALPGVPYGTAPFGVSATASSGLPVSFSSTTTAVCTVSVATVTIVSGGTCVIQATQSGNANYLDAAPVNRSFQVTAAPQTITFAAPSNKVFGAAPFTIGATASSGLTVAFTSTTSSVCTVAGFTVTLVGAGTCTIEASQAGSTNYAAATPVNRSFQVAAGSQTITFAPLSNQAFGAAPFTLSATASSGLTVSFASTTPSVCTVSASTVTLVSTGTCDIEATQAGNGNYAAATPVQRSFQVTSSAQTITFTALSNKAFGSAPFTVSATASSGLPVTFASTTTSVCTVSGAIVTLVTTGTCTIQATQSGNANYAAATAVNQSFQVTAAAQTITFTTIADQPFQNSPLALAATATSGDPVAFASTTPAVCTVSGAAATFVSLGTCSIQATQSGNANYAAATPVIRSFLVTQGTQTITFAPLSNVVASTPPFSISATATSGLPVAFASTTPAVCTVSVATVTLVGAGTCAIEATQSGNANWTAAAPVSRSFQATTGSQTITFGPLSNKVFGAAPFTVSATASSGLTVSFQSLTPAVCTVSSSTVTIVGGGTCTVQALQPGDATYAAATPVPQSFTVSTASQTITFGAIADQPFHLSPLTVSATATSGDPVSFASTTPAVCTVSGASVTFVAVGSCSIQSTQAGNANYSAATPVTRAFAITPGAQAITFGSLSSVALGASPFTVSATASSGLPVAFASTTTSVCTVAASTVAIVSAGTCTIQATQSGNTNYAAAAPVSQSFQVTSGSQTITFGPLTNRVYGSAPFTVSATASSGLPVSFNSQTTAVCAVAGSTVTLVAAGACSIQATQSGDANFGAAAPVTRSFQVTQASQTITFGGLSNQVFGTTPFAVSATASSGLTVAFASITTSVCTVSGSMVTLVAVGTCSIEATQDGNANYTAATPVSQSFQVTQASQTITFDALANQALGAAPFALTASATSGLPVSFASTTSAVCTVAGSTVTLVSAGTCAIQATQSGNSNYTAATPVSRSFQVTTTTQTITFGALGNRTYGDAPFVLSATATSGLPVSFTSTTPSVCSVSASTVTLLAAGMCSIEATQSGNGTYAAATPVSRSFEVQQASQTITFSPLSNVALDAGPVTLSATATSGLTVAFASTTTAVCTVSGTTATLLSAGACTIQATQPGNANYAAATQVSQSFQITSASQTITFSPLSNVALGAGPVTLSATATSGLTVAFASTTTAVCTVSGTTATLLSAGTCTIQATQSGNANYAAAAPVSQSFQITSASQTITFSPLSNVALGSGPVALSATATSGLTVAFASTTTAVCTVGGTTATLLSAGTCTIQATQSGNANYAAATPVSQSFQITSASQTITFSPLSNVALGSGPVALSATATSGLTVAFASTTSSVCSVSGTTAALLSAGTCTVQATQPGNANYAAATPVSRSFEVTSASQTITFSPLSNVALGAGPVTLSATATSGLTVAFASTTSSVCSVSGTTAALLSAGTCTVQATQPGNANYAAATPVSRSFEVTSASQTITFAPLTNRAFASAPFTLSATATSGLTVAFTSTTPTVCTLAATTVTLLTTGTCTIQATQPGNANYAAATPVTQTFTVTPAAQSITFTTLSNLSLNAPPFTVSATATSGLTVSFTSTTPTVCTVATTTVTLLSTGTCTIQATQPGNANYAAASAVPQTFQVLQPTAASMKATGGTPQTAPVGTRFPSPLQVTVLDAFGKPVSGATVTFTAPASGPSAILSPAYAVTNASGIVSITATAGPIVGSYDVLAATASVPSPIAFSLTNASDSNFLIDTEPAGLRYIFDGIIYTGARSIQLPTGSTHDVSAFPTLPGPFGGRYLFVGWSDQLPANHAITIGSTPGVLIARYQLQYPLTTSSNPPGAGSVLPATGFVNDRSTVSISATANPGATFRNWTGPVASPNSAATTVFVSGPTTVTANFDNTFHTVTPSPAVINYTLGTDPAAAALQLAVNTAFSEPYTVTIASPGPSPIAIVAASAAAPGAVTVRPAIAAGTRPGAYAAQLVFAFAGGARVAHDVTVMVQPGPVLNPGVSALEFTASAGTTTPQRQEQSLTASPNYSFRLAVVYTDERSRPWLSLSAEAGSTPLMLAVTADPSGLAPGVYQAGIVVTPTAGGEPFRIPVKLTITAPAIQVSTIRNAASGSADGIAPNAILSAYGTFPNCSSAGVTINGVAANVFYSSERQINFLTPRTLGTAAAADVRIVCNGATSPAVSMPVVAADPGLFTATQDGRGQAALVNQDGTISTPTHAGTYVQLYGTGFGSYAAQSPDGLDRLAAPVSATLDGVPLTIQYAGQAPGYFAALQQINVWIPADTAPGPHELLLTVGSAQTQSSVTLTVLPGTPAAN